MLKDAYRRGRGSENRLFFISTNWTASYVWLGFPKNGLMAKWNLLWKVRATGPLVFKILKNLSINSDKFDYTPNFFKFSDLAPVSIYINEHSLKLFVFLWILFFRILTWSSIFSTLIASLPYFILTENFGL